MQGKVVKEQLGVERLKPKGSVAKTAQKSQILCKVELETSLLLSYSWKKHVQHFLRRHSPL